MKNYKSVNMDMIEENTIKFINSLNKDNKFHYVPVKDGVTNEGTELKLGFMCYVSKIIYTLNVWDSFKEKTKKSWVNEINSYQDVDYLSAKNSFVDPAFLRLSSKINMIDISKDVYRFLSNNILNTKYELKKDKTQTSIRAETKQCIATLYQLGYGNKNTFLDFPQTEYEISELLNSYDWSQPWSAGAQFAGLSVFTSTQLNNQEKFSNQNILSKYINKFVNSENGCYYLGDRPTRSQLINGSMKVISGLDWLNLEIHYPEKLIDLCLEDNPSSEGCDLVDNVYVLYKCLQQTNHKRKEVNKYLKNIIDLIMLHSHSESGGFSYFKEKSQTHYYGVRISQGKNEADLHGTVLLIWAASMIFEIQEQNINDWKIIKP
jgi:hypothetical protein